MTNIVSRWTDLGESHYATAAFCDPIHQLRPLSVPNSHLPTSPPAVLTNAHTHSPLCHHNLMLSPSTSLVQSPTYQLRPSTQHRCRPSPGREYQPRSRHTVPRTPVTSRCRWGAHNAYYVTSTAARPSCSSSSLNTAAQTVRTGNRTMGHLSPPTDATRCTALGSRTGGGDEGTTAGHILRTREDCWRVLVSHIVSDTRTHRYEQIPCEIELIIVSLLYIVFRLAL